MENILSIKNIVFENILNNISINLIKGDTYCLIGHNGCGKSLLLMIAGGLQKPTEGEVLFQDISLYELKRLERINLLSKMGFVFQNAALISNMSVFDNIALGLRYHSKLKEKEIHEKVDFFLNKFRLFHKANWMPSQLSLGEKKLAGFARAAVNDPEMLFLDEPTALIDKKTSHFIIEMIEEYEDQGKAILMASNDIDLIFNTSDKVGVILNGQLAAEGEPYEIKYSDNKEIKELLSNIKLIKTEEVENEILKLLR